MDVSSYTSDSYIETEAAGFQHTVSNFAVEPFSVLITVWKRDGPGPYTCIPM